MRWQIVPKRMGELMKQGTRKQATAIMAAMMQMKKIDCAGLQKAFDDAV